MEEFLHKLLVYLFLYQMGEVLIREDSSRMIPYFLPHIKTQQDEVLTPTVTETVLLPCLKDRTLHPTGKDA